MVDSPMTAEHPSTRAAVENSLGMRRVVAALATDIANLVRGEIALARAELEDKGARVISGLVTLFGALLLVYAGTVILLLAGVAALALVIPLWAAFLVIGAVIVALGGALALMARKALAPRDLIPQRTVNNLRSDAAVIKENAT